MEICNNIINENQELWDNFFNYTRTDFKKTLQDIEHDSPYHDETVLEHSNLCVKNTRKMYKQNDSITKRMYHILDLVSKYHDCGKPFTKVNGKYFLHEIISAGIFHYTFEPDFMNNEEFLKSTSLKKIDLYVIMDIIQNHMFINSFGIDNKKSERKLIKLFKNLGKELSKLYIYFYEIDSISKVSDKDNTKEMKEKIKYMNELHLNTFSTVRLDDTKRIDMDLLEDNILTFNKLKDMTNKINTKLVIVPIGIQGSGKSKLREELMEYNNSFKFLSLDELRNSEEIDNENIFHMFEKEMKEFKTSLTKVLILDNTNINEKSRRKIIESFGYYEDKYTIIYVLFDNYLEDCYYNMKSREYNNDIPLFHVVRTLGMYHYPLLDYEERNCGNVKVYEYEN
jgi:predicted kinase